MTKTVWRPLVSEKMQHIFQDSWGWGVGGWGGACLLLSVHFPTYLLGLQVCYAVVALRICSLFNFGLAFLLLSESLFYFCKQFPVLVGQRDLSFCGPFHPLQKSLLLLLKFITLIVFSAAWGQRSFPWHSCVNAGGMNEWRMKGKSTSRTKSRTLRLL